MRHLLFFIILLNTATSLFAVTDSLKSEKKLVYKFDIKENITPATWRKTRQAFEEADSLNADLFLIHMNTYGGTVLDADSIRTKILNSKIPVYVYIDNNAASAGALISIACDSIYMRIGANIGAATVVNPTGSAMPDKYQSYMRSIMRATAEAQGKDTIIEGSDTIIKWRRDPKIAEAMVDESLYIEGISDTGKILTMTPSEAIELGFCEGISENIYDVIEKASFEEYEIREYRPTSLEKIIGLLVNPYVSGLLIMAIIGGIYFEMQTPGIGFPIGIAILAAILYFAPLYLEGLAENWEIVLFVIGLILIALEIFVIPGFGIAGISGITLAISGLILSLLNNIRFNFEWVETERVTQAFVTVITAFAAAFFLSIWGSKKIFTSTSGPFRNLALTATENKEEGFVGVETQNISMVGKKGFAITVLRPSGKIIIENDIFDAISETGFIEQGKEVTVIKYETGQLYVKKLKIEN
jgi:membrane-bound serine protease (ClpP class)